MYKNNSIKRRAWIPGLLALLLLFAATPVWAAIQGVEATAFNFTAKTGYITAADGSSLFFWGYANDNGSGVVQYPGPTMIVTEGVPVTVTLTNNLSEPTSIIFPGQQVTATGGAPGLLTNEAPPDRLTTVTYTFTPTEPGTYMFHSGSHSDLQIEMGLIGALVVRPSNYDPANPTAYGDARSAYDHEYLFLLSEMDPAIHDLVEYGLMSQVRTSTFWPVLWFINGRGAPDTMGYNCDPTLPTQPYNIMPRMLPGQRMLLRLIGGGRDMHPFHTHGNNFDLIARDGRLLESAPLAEKVVGPVPTETFLGTIPDLSVSNFTQTVAPGATYDAIFTWTGKDLGWDIYSNTQAHDCIDTTPADGYDDTTGEWCLDHNEPFPVLLPSPGDIAVGAAYSGSPFLGAAGFLPPGEGGNNANGGFFYMWHSHNEKEMVNFDIFPGGLMTMMIVEPPGTPIMPMGVCQ